eukprot:2396702-Pyramimonas_sp.AAC.1
MPASSLPAACLPVVTVAASPGWRRAGGMGRGQWSAAKGRSAAGGAERGGAAVVRERCGCAHNVQVP